MKKTLFMHMGWPKTGTTSIQRFLFKNKILLQNHGYCYAISHVPPFKLFNYYYENQIFALRAYDGPLPGNDWQWYRDKINEEMQTSNSDKYIFSGEMGIYEHTDNLKFWQERYNVKPIYYLRAFFDFVYKQQQEFIKYTLSPGVFTMDLYRNHRMLAAVKYQVPFFGRENCIFIDYDKMAKNKNLINSFLEIAGLSDIKGWEHIENANITPNEAHLNVLFQLSFVPMSLKEFVLIREDLKKMDFSGFDAFKSNTLPPNIFELDDYAHWALKYQGELLNDPSWYEKNLERCDALSKKPYEDLPPELQFKILENFSDDTRKTLEKYLPAVKTASPAKTWLPSMKDWHKSRHLILPLYFKHIKNERSLKKGI